MAGIARKSSKTGVVEIKKCGFNTRPKLMVPDPAGDEDATVDVLPDLFSELRGQKGPGYNRDPAGMKSGQIFHLIHFKVALFHLVHGAVPGLNRRASLRAAGNVEKPDAVV